MNLAFSDDQNAFLDAVERIAVRHETKPVLGPVPFEVSPALDADLEEAGVFEAASIDELGPVAATAMVVRLARLPQVVELVATSLALPLLASHLRRPCAVLWDRRDRPVRFLPGARTAICVRGELVEFAELVDVDVVPLASPFGYPMGRLHSPDTLEWQPRGSIHVHALRTLWRIGVAAELAGALGAALDAVVAHVRDRRQFGRPLGAFQAIQHRLAEAAVKVEATRWLALQAAQRRSAADALAAVGYAQQSASTVVYDLHQFMGAMGLTLEHPLHRWTTRARLLRAELGGTEAQYASLADAAWPASESRKAAR